MNNSTDNNGLYSEESEYKELIEKVRSLPDVDPPEELISSIMEALNPQRPAWWRRFYLYVARPRTFTITPIKWVPVAICIFALVFVFQFKPQIPNQYPDRHTVTESKDPVANYFEGRSHLATNNPEKALPFLKKATIYAPNVADYHFWLGVAYCGLSELEKEQQSYQRAIAFDQNHISAHLYSGHNYLDRGAWEKALEQYDKVLSADPDNPVSLYNRGLSLMQMGRLREERNAWAAYLSRFETGEKARSAAARLNTLGDFSYRTFLFGRRNVVLKSISFEQKQEKPGIESRCSLDRVGSILENNRAIVLHIVVHTKDNERLAERRSKNIKKYLLANFPKIEPARLKVSWFKVPETVLLNGKTYTLNTSVRFITETFNTV